MRKIPAETCESYELIQAAGYFLKNISDLGEYARIWIDFRIYCTYIPAILFVIVPFGGWKFSACLEIFFFLAMPSFVCVQAVFIQSLNAMRGVLSPAV